MSEAKKYRKKPVVIEAMQVTSENFKSLSEWLPHDGTALILASPGCGTGRIVGGGAGKVGRV